MGRRNRKKHLEPAISEIENIRFHLPVTRFFKLPYRAYRAIQFFFRKPRYNAKVFCIGYNKTGTSSLAKSLEMLGYMNGSFNKKLWRKYYKNNQINKILRYTARLDSAGDLPWLMEDMIPILDQTFPNSKFIYLTRDEESWKRSFREWKYKKTGAYPDAEKSWQKFLKHRDFVMNYFHDAPDDKFIILDIKDKNGFKKLADFLNIDTQRKGFPRVNKTHR